MTRSFVALPLPEEIVDRLDLLAQTLPLDSRVDPEGYHITLAFLGEVDGPTMEELDAALDDLAVPAFELAISGVAMFGGREPRLLYAAVTPDPALTHLQRKVSQAARNVGVEVPARRFVPHVTLSRRLPKGPDYPRLEAAVAAATVFRAGPWTADCFTLYASHRTGAGAVYEALEDYPLAGAAWHEDDGDVASPP